MALLACPDHVPRLLANTGVLAGLVLMGVDENRVENGQRLLLPLLQFHSHYRDDN